MGNDLAFSGASFRVAMDLQGLCRETAEGIRDEHAAGHQGGGGEADGGQKLAVVHWIFFRHWITDSLGERHRQRLNLSADKAVQGGSLLPTVAVRKPLS
jgi:hypothetical protein